MRNRYILTIAGKTDPSRFIRFLSREGVVFSSITEQDGVITCTTDQRGLAAVRKYRRKFRVTAKIRRADEESVERRLFSSYFFLIACFIPLLSSFFLWHVEIDTDIPEVEERIGQKLNKADIRPMILSKRLPDEGEIRDYLMADDPSLSWVRFKRSGSTLTVIPMMSPKLSDNTQKAGPPSDLIARTGGVITNFHLSRGERVARLHQTVKKGDQLATGILEMGGKKKVVGAEGSVFADYWTSYSFKLPRTIEYRSLEEETVEFSFDWPVRYSSKNGLTFAKPFTVERKRVDRSVKTELTEGMEESVIIPLIKSKIMSESNTDMQIKEENILHVTFENDTVNGTILFLMNDNIAIKRPISKETEDY